MEGDDTAIMVIGPDDFPVPIPLVRKGGEWRFDTAAGREEILFRRIGKNELDAIQACLAYVDAQNEYTEKDRTSAGVNAYAQRIVSRPGKKDGLYWPTSQGEDPSSRWASSSPRRPRRATALAAGGRLSWLLFQDFDAAGTGRARRRTGLCRARQHDRRICAGCLSGRIPQFGRDDISRESFPAPRYFRKTSGRARPSWRSE